MYRSKLYVCAAAVALLAAAPPHAVRAAAHDHGAEHELTCDGSESDGDRASHCEIREAAIKDFSGRLDVDPGVNGGVSVRGWDRNEVLVRAKVQTRADTDEQAAALATRVTIETAGGRVRVAGPDFADDVSWSVTFQISVPRRSDVALRTTNGGISLSGLSGNIEFEALNGGVSLREMGGNVHGHTTNGGLSVALSGDRWDGEALDVFTVNGGVSVTMPEGYSARFETGTVHGQLALDIPVTVQAKTKQVSTTLGSGGPLVRVATTNGGVVVRQSN
jgi:hypothetical protein